MKNTFRLSAVLLIWAFVASCQKDFQNNLDPVLPRDSVILLSRLIFFDPTAPTDTLSYSNIFYDSLHRVVTGNNYEFDNGIPYLLSKATYYYKGTDVNAFEAVFEEAGTPNIDTTFYFYDSQQRLDRDSTISFEIGNSESSIIIHQYNYSDSMIIDMAHNYTINGNPQDTFMYADTGFRRSAGDIYKATVSTLPGIVSISYDDHPNPFYQLNIRSAYSPLPDFGFDIYDEGLLKNNALSIHHENFLYPAGTYTETYSYTYNSSGLPEVANSFQDNVADERVVFIYKKL